MSTLDKSAFRVVGLGRKRTEELRARAKQLGMTPRAYLRHLVEADLSSSAQEKECSFKDLLGAGRQVDEDELDRLVEEAKVDRYRARSKRRG